MISFYNTSVSTDSDVKLTQIDLLIDCEEQNMAVFVNEKFMVYAEFFEKEVKAVSSVLLYNLYNSVSYWQDLVICSQICYNFNSEFFLNTSIVFAFLLGLLFV